MMFVIYICKGKEQKNEGRDMKVSREQVAANRARILDAAGRLFRERGYDAVSVAEVMQAAGLTHGGFYGHFRSKDDLIAQTLAHVLQPVAVLDDGLDAYAAFYLSPAHCDARGEGCATAALASDTALGPAEARTVMTERLRAQLDRLTALTREERGGDQARERAITRWAAMVGAVILARATDDPVLAEELLAATRVGLERL
jgi:TetR/AcrR family transcriptional regulator, transcriptional repressor for nem operon